MIKHNITEATNKVENRATLEDVVKNMQRVNAQDVTSFYIEVVEAFEDYEFNGVDEVLVTTPGYSYFILREGWHNAYINHEDAPTIEFEIKLEDNWYLVSNVQVKGY